MRTAAFALAALCGCATVPAGQGGVVWSARDGVQREPLGEGEHYIGLMSTVHLYDLRAQERNEDLVGVAADGGEIEAGASVVTFHLIAEELPALDREIGPQYYDNVVGPLVRASARRVMARLRAGELDTPSILWAQEALRARLADALRPLHISLDGVVFRRVVPRTPLAYRAVIDAGTMEQRSLTAQSQIEAAQRRADQLRAEARGVAAAHELVSPTLTRPALDELRVRAWERLLTAPSTSVLTRPGGESPLLLEVPP